MNIQSNNIILEHSEIKTKNGIHWRAEVVFLDHSRMYQGKITRNNFEIYSSAKAMSLANVIRWTNEYIRKLNIQHEIHPTLLDINFKKAEKANTLRESQTTETTKDQKLVKQPKQNKTPSSSQQSQSSITPTEQIKNTMENVKPNSNKPKRKPFTPYGLNGYLVDKQGNVRLMLDRKASAHTIVLEPQMFNALADMVRKTQEQTSNDTAVLS